MGMKSFFRSLFGKKHEETPAFAPAEAAAPFAQAKPERAQLSAVIAAAIAADMGTEPAGLRILSIRRAEPGKGVRAAQAQPERGALTAAVAAAIAADMGTEPAGLRIRSIRRVTPARDGGALAAAIAAAIAADMGTEPVGLRILSVRRVA